MTNLPENNSPPTMTPNRTRLSLAALVAAVVLAGTASCAMPSDNEAHVVSIGEEHRVVLEPAPTSEVTTTTAREATLEVGLYFIEDDKLRRQPWDMAVSRAENLTSVLNQLLQGTYRQNFRTAIPTGVEIIDTRINDATRVATIVLLDNTLFSIEGNDRLRAIAQIVFTATDRNRNNLGVERVQFEIDGDLLTIPKGDGTDTSQPVGRCDYATSVILGDQGGADFIDPSRDCPSTNSTTSTTSPGDR